MFAADASPDAVHKELDALLARLHVLVIGRGLGRSDSLQNYARDALRLARQREISVVIDADGLYMVQKRHDVVKGYQCAVLTPNVVEYGLLCEALCFVDGAQDVLNDIGQAFGDIFGADGGGACHEIRSEALAVACAS